MGCVLAFMASACLASRHLQHPHAPRRARPPASARATRVADHLGAIEARAQRGGMRVGAAQAAADAAVDHGGHRVDLQRIGVVLQRQGRAARQADAGVVAVAHLVVDAVLDAHHTFAALQQRAIQGLTRRCRSSWHSPSAMITLRPLKSRGERLDQRLAHRLDVVGVHRAQPLHAEARPASARSSVFLSTRLCALVGARCLAPRRRAWR